MLGGETAFFLGVSRGCRFSRCLGFLCTALRLLPFVRFVGCAFGGGFLLRQALFLRAFGGETLLLSGPALRLLPFACFAGCSFGDGFLLRQALFLRTLGGETLLLSGPALCLLLCARFVGCSFGGETLLFQARGSLTLSLLLRGLDLGQPPLFLAFGLGFLPRFRFALGRFLALRGRPGGRLLGRFVFRLGASHGFPGRALLLFRGLLREELLFLTRFRGRALRSFGFGFQRFGLRLGFGRATRVFGLGALMGDAFFLGTRSLRFSARVG